MLGIKTFDFRLTLRNIISNKVEFLVTLPGFRIDKSNGPQVNEDRSLNPPSSALAHTAPVLEAVGNKIIGRDGRDRLIPVSHFYRVQVDCNHVTIGVELRHLNPVAYPHHVVGRDLNACYDTENGILEDQKDNGGHCTKRAKQDHRRFIQKQRDDSNTRRDVQENAGKLEIASDRFMYECLRLLQQVLHGS